MGPSYLHQIPLVANGNIRPYRALTGVAGTPYVAVEAADSTLPCLGFAKGDRRYPPGSAADDGFHAIALEGVRYIGPGQRAQALIGTAITDVTKPLIAVTDGTLGAGCVKTALTAGTTLQWTCALPERLGAAGEIIPVLVLFPQAYHPALS